MKNGVSRAGQFIVITAIIIGMVVMSTAILIYETQVYEQHFRYHPYQDVTIDLENDVKRALACSLANATIRYNKTWAPLGALPKWDSTGFDNGERNARQYMQQWRLTAINAFAGLGANLVVSNASRNLVNMTWAKKDSMSSANATIMVNMTTIGMFSWQRNISVALRVTVNMSSITSSGSCTNLTFRALEDNQQIVNDLPNTSIKVSFYDTVSGKWKNASVNFCDYYGNGVYSIEFNKTYTKGLQIVMWVQDRRGILVAAGFTLP